MPFHLILPIFIFSIIVVNPAWADYQVSIDEGGGYIHIRSNGLPNHETGQFPNRGNPNAISAQNHNYRVTQNPVKNAEPKEHRGVIGVALNGVPFEPGTAEFWNNDRNYNYEAIDGSVNLGLDDNNAHVQPTGTYHYHGIPTPLVKNGFTHIGYAADGFKIYADAQNRYKSSYRLKSGQRSGGPGGKYDGSFTSDYEYVADLSVLDECNGATINGTYGYIATESFPFLPRCLYGTPDESFERKRGGRSGAREGQRRPPPHHHRHHQR
ncbi:MAG: YHYH protein [Pseudomonadota bacterium]